MKFGSFRKGIIQTGNVCRQGARKMLGSKTQQVIEEKRTFCNEELHRILQQTLQTPSNQEG